MTAVFLSTDSIRSISNYIQIRNHYKNFQVLRKLLCEKSDFIVYCMVKVTSYPVQTINIPEVFMQTAGIIAEYNPFHQGHFYHLQETRKRTGADYCIVVMSGNFVQRGEAAIFEKGLRTRMALLGGADLVLELPAPFAVGSAEDFASAAVSLLNQLGVVSVLSFGSECEEIEPLKRAAQIFLDEPEPFRNQLKRALKEGNSFPKSRSLALASVGFSPKELAVLRHPNTVLGIEYLKALFRQNSEITPVSILRKGDGYHDTTLKDYAYASASAIRHALFSYSEKQEKEADFPEFLLAHVPSVLHPLYQKEARYPVYPDDCSLLLNYRLLSCSLPFEDFWDISSELAGRIRETAKTCSSFTDHILALKTRQYTYTRISRALIHLVLSIKQTEIENYKKIFSCAYARVLGFKKSAAPLLHAIKANSEIPLITKAASAKKLLSAEAFSLWEKDIYSSHLYHAILQQKYGITLPNEYSRPVIIL